MFVFRRYNEINHIHYVISDIKNFILSLSKQN